MILLEWLGGLWLVVLAATFGLVPGIAVRAFGQRRAPLQPALVIAALAVEYCLCASLRSGFGPVGGLVLTALMAGTAWGWWHARLAWDAQMQLAEERTPTNAEIIEAFCLAFGRG